VVHNETGLTRPRIGMKLVTVSWRHFAVVAVGLVVVMVVAGILLYPTLYVQYIQEFGIKRFRGSTRSRRPHRSRVAFVSSAHRSRACSIHSRP
jgi:hypothetical protein